jgi:small subunit ribosomal protein S17
VYGLEEGAHEPADSFKDNAGDEDSSYPLVQEKHSQGQDAPEPTENEEIGDNMPRRVLHGIVVNDKNDKTVMVKVEQRVMHPIYKKYVRVHKKYAAHDEANKFKIGEMVRIIESRPISKTKKWVVEPKAAVEEGQANDPSRI